MQTPPRSNTGRSGAAVTKREFDQLRTDLIAQFTTMRGEIQELSKQMLPRELYNAEQRGVAADISDMQQRLAKLETTNIDLNNQLLNMRASTGQQITKSVGDVRTENLARMLDMAVRVGFMVVGGIVTFVAYYLGTHTH